MPLRALTQAAVFLLLSLTAGGASATAAAPKSVTQPATAITPVGATLNGTVDPRGQATSASFQYGLTKSYGKNTPLQSAGLTPGPVPISANVSGLKSSTKYHFRIVGESKDGKTFGADKTFKTAAPTTTPVFTPNPVLYGDPVAVSGQIVGTGAAGADVSLFGRVFPFTDPLTQFGNTVVADAQGNYLFILSSALSTAQFEVRGKTNPPFKSTTQTLQVASKISLHVRSRVRKGRKVLFSGTVQPAQDGIVVEIQKRRRDGTFARFARTTLRHRSGNSSGYSVRKRLRRTGTFQAVVQSAGGVVVAGTSGAHSVRVRRR
jgi:hypothetical protein